MPRLRKIKLNNTTYDIAPSKLSDGTYEMTLPTLTGNTVVQEQLVSGTNIKTINNISLLGSGNIDVAGGGGEANVIEAITFNGSTVPISSKVAAITSNEDKLPLVSVTPTASTTIDPYKMYSFGTITTSVIITFNSSPVPSGYCAEYAFRFVAGANCAITLPSPVKYNGGAAPTFTTGRTYEYNIVDNLCVVGEFYA